YQSLLLFFSVPCCLCCISSFFFNHTPTTEIYTLSLHDALPISIGYVREPGRGLALDPDEQAQEVVRLVFDQFDRQGTLHGLNWRSEEHTSELQSRENLVCRLLLEKKKKKK